MKVLSIHRKLVRSLSISITSVIVVILILTDVAVDTWVHDEFDRAIHTKANLLTTLIKQDIQGIEFEFAGELMPEFEQGDALEYFQIWQDKEVYERSESLDLFLTKTFDYKALKVDEERVEDIVLPDGRAGQILYYRFYPQVDTDKRQAYKDHLLETGTEQKPILMAYAASAEKLNFVTWLIDISFLVSTISVALIVRFLVKRTVTSGLKPLDEFIASLDSIEFTDRDSAVSLETPVEELIPIQNSINSFIAENRSLYLKEQRLTSDIAHELKTPIAELINLAEVAIKFPHDRKLAATLNQDVLDIGTRLQSIVSNILLLHRYSNAQVEKNDVFDVVQVLARITAPIEQQIAISCGDNIDPITSNLFLFETIFSNLLNNAHTYSPNNSVIKLHICTTAVNRVLIEIKNTCSQALSEADLPLMFQPLWQKDSARTSANNFGLGLTLVDTFCRLLGADVQVSLHDDKISFKVELIG